MREVRDKGREEMNVVVCEKNEYGSFEELEHR